MATVHRLHIPEREPEAESVFGRLARLMRLELELGMAEARHVIISAVVTAAAALVAAIALIAAVVVLLAGALAPLFGAPWPHLVTAGGVVAVLSVITIAVAAVRLRRLNWPKETLTSFEENWRWLGAQLRSRLTLR